MAGHQNRLLNSLKAWGVVLTLILGFSIFCTELTWGESYRFSRKVYARQMKKFSQEIVPDDRESIYSRGNQGTRNRMRRNKEFYFQAKNYKKDYRSLTPEEKARLKGRYRKWQSLPQERQQMLRHRMEKWRQLPPERREHFQQWFQQWKELSPNERGAIRKKLDKWDMLPPDEQEKLRRRFHKNRD